MINKSILYHYQEIISFYNIHQYQYQMIFVIQNYSINSNNFHMIQHQIKMNTQKYLSYVLMIVYNIQLKEMNQENFIIDTFSQFKIKQVIIIILDILSKNRDVMMIYNLYNRQFCLARIILDYYLGNFVYFIMKKLNFLLLIILNQYLLIILSFSTLNNWLLLITNQFFFLCF